MLTAATHVSSLVCLQCTLYICTIWAQYHQMSLQLTTDAWHRSANLIKPNSSSVVQRWKGTSAALGFLMKTLPTVYPNTSIGPNCSDHSHKHEQVAHKTLLRCHTIGHQFCFLSFQFILMDPCEIIKFSFILLLFRFTMFAKGQDGPVRGSGGGEGEGWCSSTSC